MGDKEVAYVGPYKATKVWNDVIAAFRQYLNCGRHRRYMKTFDNCFSGSAAIEWLLHYLKTNDSFQSDISRAKAASLVNKLYHAGIFEEVQVTKSMRHKAEVLENRLYRFLPISPSKIKISRLPLAPRNDSGLFQNIARSKSKENIDSTSKKIEKTKDSENKPQTRLSRKISILKKEKAKKDASPAAEEMSYPPCHIITRILTTKEIKDTWKAVFTQRLQKVLGVSRLGDIVAGDLVDGYNIMHNCIYLNKSGVVTNIDLAEQLPHWVMSAMKCLAHWPEPAEPGLPNYPGFEKDVFRVIRDYFLALEEPLVPFSLYDLFTTVFVMCGHQSPEKPASVYQEDDSADFTVPSSLWTSASLENIILNLTKKYCTLDTVSHHRGTHEDLRSVGVPSEREKHFASQEDLRFAGQVHDHFNDYNRSAFPSTDGMDRVRSLSRFASQESYPALPHRDFLSKSTQSAAYSRPTKSQRGLRRMYGSTPNLKVSKYETAFGPDNRTVTRVFYQNGFTTDLSHDLDDNNDEVFPSFPDQTHQSARCMQINEAQTSGRHPDTRRSMVRSKSAYIDDDPYQRPYSSSTLDTNHKAATRALPRASSMNVSIGETITLPQAHHDSSQASIHSASLTPAQTLVPGTRKSEHFQAEPARQGNSIPQASPAVRSIVTSPALFYPTEEKKTPMEQQRSQSCLLKEMYGPGYRPQSRSRSQLLVSAATRTSTSSLHSIVSGNIGTLGTEDENYRPVLDASKERKLLSSSSFLLEPHSKSPPRHNISHDCEVQPESSGERYTSTPMSRSFDNANLPYLGGESCPPSCISAYPSTVKKGLNTSGSTSTRFMNYPQTRLSEERARNSLQLAALLLPPARRRKLHLLFKLMVKMTSNPNLCLDPTQTTRSLVLSTFYRSILRSRKDEEEMVVLQLVSFMLDFYAEILSPPDNIKTQVSERLKVLQNPQVVYSPRPDRSVRFCQQVSSDEFENQRLPTSQMSALEELLENIVRSENMTDKEKRRRLKQFQRTYPAVYTRRFPNPETEARVLPQVKSKPKIKQPFVMKPLQNKFKGLRL